MRRGRTPPHGPRSSRSSRPRSRTPTRACGAWSGPSGSRSRRWRSAPFTTIGTTPASGTSSPASWRCGWRSTCSGGSRPAVSTLQVDLQPQRQEAGDDVPDAGVVPMVVKGADLQRRLLLPEGPLHAPQALVGARDLVRWQRRVGPQDELPIEARVGLDRGAVDRHATPLDGDEAGEALVADHRLGPVRERGLELREDRGPCGGVLPRLIRIATHHVTPALDPDLLHLQIVGHLLIAPGPGQHDAADFLVLP